MKCARVVMQYPNSVITRYTASAKKIERLAPEAPGQHAEQERERHADELHDQERADQARSWAMPISVP